MEILEPLARQAACVDDGRRRHDSRAVLVVVHDGYVEPLYQAPLDLEAFGGLDVFEADAAERGRYARYAVDEGVYVVGVDLDVEGVDVGHGLEEHALALHDGLGCCGAYVAQSQYGRAVGYDGYQIAARGVAVAVVGIALDSQRRCGYAGRVCQREVVLRGAGLGNEYGRLARPRKLVVAKRFAVYGLVVVHSG